MIEIVPSILAADFAKLGDEVAQAASGGASMVHVDVMDGRFVPNITIGPPVVASLRQATDLFIDCHLMIVEPERYLEAFRRAGADAISVHVEAVPHLQRTVSEIRKLGAQAGVALNPATPLSVLDEILDELDFVLIMSVNPGFGGQKFIHSGVDKTRKIREMIGDRPIHIQIDGGVDPTTAPLVAAAGADVLVAGSAVFRGGSVENPAPYGENIRAIRTAAEGAVKNAA